MPVDPAVADESITPAVLAGQDGVVRVEGTAPSCSRQVTGSGFVYAPDMVVTNAHVVAGVVDPVVTQLDGDRHDAEVVYFDPSADLAVLRVPDLTAPALTFGTSVATGDPVATLGYPGGGALKTEPGRVRTRREIAGPDIYHTETVTREVYALRAHVLPGDSGGPVMAPDGTVVGVVFAASLDDADTAYAFTADEVQPVIERGIASKHQVGTGACA
jgi:S1-C subfamily serine protease